MEYQEFEKRLCDPDTIYKTASQQFDNEGKGKITLYDFMEMIKNTELNQKLPFDMNNDFLKLYFGHEPQATTYKELSQSLNDTKAGNDDEDGFKVNFPFYSVFNSLVNKMELVKQAYLNVINSSQIKELNNDEFQYQAHKKPHITSTEVLLKLCQLSNEQQKMVYSDLQSMPSDKRQIVARPLLLRSEDDEHHPYKKKIIQLVSSSDKDKKEPRSILMSVLESLYRLTLGFMAGATGAAAVYPIDLVKTRMQNQRIHPESGERMYKHSFDCFYKVVKFEGIRGLYRGLLPQVCGVAPEKATKLTVNDFIRDQLKEPDGSIPLWAEVFAGATGGACQVTFSNPVEIIKIQLQVAGEVKDVPRPSALAVFKEKFFFGLYKGASACYCRDVTFAGIYFPTYANVKKLFVDEHGYNKPHTLFFSGFVAGMPAAFFATPFDVVKTRLQVKPRPGQTTYSGFRHTFKTVWREEGWTAFWKGAGARVCRSSPQFAVTLFTYELLQRLLYYDFGGHRSEGSERHSTPPKKVSYNPDHTGGYGAAIPMITGIETKFGISLPKFNIVPIPIPRNEKKEDEP
ncbi:calcium-binding mitochondrial carrier protein Aralar1 isoform X2 [Halyomorpha halys]|uniref:calcium-binding mitochondrial carrier protein Aralar1 isoform X2 n=1 Tax=Halyomorpha halys TaxID=286706 RepID=UPI0006D4D212|nr:calcium-binding mitochondrial carrier protein Aralar1-like isoform X2 [Halyomorpha halys]